MGREGGRGGRVSGRVLESLEGGEENIGKLRKVGGGGVEVGLGGFGREARGGREGGGGVHNECLLRKTQLTEFAGVNFS